VLGTGLGGFDVMTEAVHEFMTGERIKPSPFAIASGLINMPAHHVSVETQAVGPILPVTTACAAGSQALVHALEFMRLGYADVMFAGGAEATVQDYVIAGFGAMKALATGWNDRPTEGSRPFDRDRNGFVLGEGATIFCLETLEHAEKRGARIYAELLGGASCSDTFHVTSMDPEALGAQHSMKWAIERAGLNLEDIDYINAHGTSTEVNDRLESRAIKLLFGERAYELPVSSTKSMIGHCMGAAGAIEAAACLHMLRDQVVHPTMNYTTPDPDCDLDYVPNQAREVKLKYILSNNFGMGGQNASIVLGKI
jgi:3-oxoacyl-(acyl-carrier-protein) synthase